MLTNYFKTAFRTLWKSKGQTLITISGLGIGIGCCLLIILFVNDELTFDSFHSRSDRLYRAWFKVDHGNSNAAVQTTTPFPLGNALLENFEEVESAVRLIHIAPWVKVNDNQHVEKVTFAGKDFFRVFDFPRIGGSSIIYPIGPNETVITEATAIKYFGRNDPVNQSLSIQIGEEFERFAIKEVVADPPSNSSIQFEILIADANLEKLYSRKTLDSEWGKGFPETYVLLKEGASASALERKLPLIKKVLSPDFQGEYEIGLQPVTDIHLNSDFPSSFSPVGNLKYSLILGGIAFLILLMACINFVTLLVGMSLSRSKEIGLRKVVGAERQQLIAQFIGEGMLVALLSLIIGFFIAVISLPAFNGLSGKSLSFHFDRVTLVAGPALLLITGLLAGSYPALILSGLKPIAVLQQWNQTRSRQRIRKVLVSLQLVLSVFLISSTLAMREQLEYVQTMDMGFNEGQLIALGLDVAQTGNMIEVINAGFDKAKLFKAELSRYPDLRVSSASHLPGMGSWTSIGFSDDQGAYGNFDLNIVDERFIPALEITIAAGRNFSAENPADAERAIIVNEAFAKAYGLKDFADLAGKGLPGEKFADHEIIGVVEDFNYSSLYRKIEPLVLTMNTFIPLSGMENISVKSSPIPKLIVRLPPENPTAALEIVREIWNKLSGVREFSPQYVDEKIDGQYRNDRNLSNIAKIATLIAVSIGGLGLYALALLTMQSRAKEISIRKVMGASESYLMLLLAKDYIFLIIICILVSVPVTYYFIHQWLQSFEYRISPGWRVFSLSGALALTIGILVIGHQTIKLARIQPADTLKSE